MAGAPPLATPVSLRRTAAKPQEVAITYVGHSTYYIDTPEGVRIGTDFNGYYRTGRLPDVVTMNRAHSTHYTLFPDPKIPHVLHGWGENGQAAHVSTRVGDVYIRNVPTDIRRYYGDDSGSAISRTATRSSSSRSPASASAISDICTTSSTTRISRRSAGSTS